MNEETNPGSERWRELYPFTSRFADVGGHRLHYVDEGNGNPILFVHGNPTWSFYYRNLVQRLRSDNRAIAVDHLGCGLSDKPQKFDYCLQRHIDNLQKLVESLDLNQITLVAHDWGGAIGLGTVLRCPKRFRAIQLFNTGAFPPPYIPSRIRVCRWPVIGKIAVQGFNAFARAATKMASEQPGGLDAIVAEGLIGPYDSWSNRIAIHKFVEDIPLAQNHRTWQVLTDIENGLQSLKSLPINLIWGMKDWCFRPECLDRFVSHWPNAEVHKITDAGHYVVEDAVKQVCDLTDQFVRQFDGKRK